MISSAVGYCGEAAAESGACYGRGNDGGSAPVL